MATSLASQLKSLQSLGNVDLCALKRPFTRPSILFDPREAADIDLATIYSIALSGLDDLIDSDGRFEQYRNSLFSRASMETDRELMTAEENGNIINSSVAAYLRLLSAHLQRPSALKTLEYLIRRYKVHTYNVDDLVLCTLPYHDTHAFVRILQITELRGNKTWSFLEGVKSSGAPMPRKLLVQQCLRDPGVLDALCSYVMPVPCPGKKKKELQSSHAVISFCTAVIVEALGSAHSHSPPDSDNIKRILPLILLSLSSSSSRSNSYSNSSSSSDYKASAMMMVGVLASRRTLAPGLVHDLISSVARSVQQEANEFGDLSWLKMSLMVIANLVQSQSVKILPWKGLKVLVGLRDVPVVFAGLAKEFNIDRFISVYLESLVHYSITDDLCHVMLIKMIETVPMKGLVANITCKVLSAHMLPNKAGDSDLSKSEGLGAKVLVALQKHYSIDFSKAVRIFLDNPKVLSKEKNSVLEGLDMMLDVKPGLPLEIRYFKILFSLEHPKADIRRGALVDIAKNGIVEGKTVDLKFASNLREALFCRVYDSDLSVVAAALSISELSTFIDHPSLVKALKELTWRCLDILKKGDSISKGSSACDIATTCLSHAFDQLRKLHKSHPEEVAAILFPFLLVLPKTWKLNVKALEIVSEMNWLFYENLGCDQEAKDAFNARPLDTALLSSLNDRILHALAENLKKDPGKHMLWMMESCTGFELPKTFACLIILKSFLLQRGGTQFHSFLGTFEACFPFLRSLWQDIDLKGCNAMFEGLNLVDAEQSFFEANFYNKIASKCEGLDVNLLICIFWVILNAFALAKREDSIMNTEHFSDILDDLFVLFVTSHSKSLLKDHIWFLVTNCSFNPITFLSNIYTNDGASVLIQMESLHSFAAICSGLTRPIDTKVEEVGYSQLLLVFPSLLVPICSTEQCIRGAAIDCLASLYDLWCRQRDSFTNDEYSFSPEHADLLKLLVQQRKMILLDPGFLKLHLKSFLSSSNSGHFATQNFDMRFDEKKREGILQLILKCALGLPSHGKVVMLSMLKGVGHTSLIVEETKQLLSDLLGRYGSCPGMAHLKEKLSVSDIETICSLLEIWFSSPASPPVENVVVDHLFNALAVGNLSPGNECKFLEPCTTALQSINYEFYNGLAAEVQDALFHSISLLSRNNNSVVKTAARDALMRIHVNGFTICRHLEVIIFERHHRHDYSNKRKKMSQKPQELPYHGVPMTTEQHLLFLMSLLDLLLLKRDLDEKASLIEPLLKLLCKTNDKEWHIEFFDESNCDYQITSGGPQHIEDSVRYIQETTLCILEDISTSLSKVFPVNDDAKSFNVGLLVKFMRSSLNSTTLNHTFSLITSIAKLVPDQVLEHMVDICQVLGESTVKQGNGHSMQAFESLMSTLIPCWLSKSNSSEKLLQIFVDILHQLSPSRRLAIVTCLLRELGESDGLSSLLILLLKSLMIRAYKSISLVNMSTSKLVSSLIMDWEYLFAAEVSSLYPCSIWLSAVVRVFDKLATGNMHISENVVALLLSMHLIMHKLEDTELAFRIDAGGGTNEIQELLGTLMRGIVSHTQVIERKLKKEKLSRNLRKELRECANNLLDSLLKLIKPSVLYNSMAMLLVVGEGKVQRKALGLLCGYVQRNGNDVKKYKRQHQVLLPSPDLALDSTTSSSFNRMCSEIFTLVDGHVDMSLKMAAMVAAEALAITFPSSASNLKSFLVSIYKQISVENVTICSCCLKSVSALVNALGPAVLPLLPSLVDQVLKAAEKVSVHLEGPLQDVTTDQHSNEASNHKTSILLSVLGVVEALITKIGDFLNPYLRRIIRLLLLTREYVSGSNHQIIVQASEVQSLLSMYISVRLLVEPLLETYPEAVKCGDSSLSRFFEMMTAMIGKMDKAFIARYHAKLFEQCLDALDLRRQHLPTIEKINLVEESVASTTVALTMKLTERLFKPLFSRGLVWVSELTAGSLSSENVDRNIAFYKLINKLAEQHRSLFVPYFKSLLENSIYHLTEGEYSTEEIQKYKKAKNKESDGKSRHMLPTPGQWQLRALIISALHKCFLYDTGNPKFLENSNFQNLLKPIVTQVAVTPPTILELELDIPSVQEVDDLLVSCIGQMAMTAGTDLSWKPLNHEVLMQTRNEKIRPRILGLRVVKFLLDNLKEEYLILLPETIPFLSELLEDADLRVKSLTQEILRDMESLSGESLGQYL